MDIMKKKHQKPKFIPPIVTADSFLRSISKNPEISKFPTKRVSVIKEFIPEFPSKYEISLKSLESPNAKSQIISRSPKFTRDVSHLQDILKESKSDPSLPALSSIHILPTSPEHLRKLLNASETHSRCNSRGHLCNKEKCLEDFLDRSMEMPEPKKKADETSRSNLQLGLPTGKHDIHNLTDWYSYMKSNYLGQIIKTSNKIDSPSYENFESDLDILELVVKGGIKECTRQVKVQSLDRGEVLEELIENFELFWKTKNKDVINKLKFRIRNLKDKNLRIIKEKENMEYEYLETQRNV